MLLEGKKQLNTAGFCHQTYIFIFVFDSIKILFRDPGFDTTVLIIKLASQCLSSNPPLSHKNIEVCCFATDFLFCGEGGIRTPEPVTQLLPFQGSALDRSATSPIFKTKTKREPTALVFTLWHVKSGSRYIVPHTFYSAFFTNYQKPLHHRKTHH